MIYYAVEDIGGYTLLVMELWVHQFTLWLQVSPYVPKALMELLMFPSVQALGRYRESGS